MPVPFVTGIEDRELFEVFSRFLMSHSSDNKSFCNFCPTNFLFSLKCMLSLKQKRIAIHSQLVGIAWLNFLFTVHLPQSLAVSGAMVVIGVESASGRRETVIGKSTATDDRRGFMSP